MMHQRSWLISGIVTAAIIAAFLFSVPRTTEVVEELPAASVEVVPSVSVKDTFRRGVHTLLGTVEAPDACSVVSAEATHEEADTENAHILLSVNMTVSEGLCLEVPTDMRFSVTVTAPDDLPIITTVNGASALLE